MRRICAGATGTPAANLAFVIANVKSIFQRLVIANFDIGGVRSSLAGEAETEPQAPLGWRTLWVLVFQRVRVLILSCFPLSLNSWETRDKRESTKSWMRGKSVGFFAMAEGMKHHVAFENVVAQAIVAPADAPLAFARLQAFQLFDGVPPCPAVGIFPENAD